MKFFPLEFEGILYNSALTKDPLYKKNFKLHNWPIPAPISDYFSKNEPIAGLY